MHTRDRDKLRLAVTTPTSPLVHAEYTPGIRCHRTEGASHSTRGAPQPKLTAHTTPPLRCPRTLWVRCSPAFSGSGGGSPPYKLSRRSSACTGLIGAEKGPKSEEVSVRAQLRDREREREREKKKKRERERERKKERGRAREAEREREREREV